MGYCYESGRNGRRGRLCCDVCNKAGGVRKYPCPFGYCQPIAACRNCRRDKAREFGKEAHRENGCERMHAEFEANLRLSQSLLASGKAVRCSALSTDDGRVHVLFRKQDGTTVGHYMAHETYDAHPLGTPRTVDDYAAVGPLEPAPPEFGDGRTTKQVPAIA